MIKTFKSIFQTYKVGKEFWGKINKPTTYDLYKILILESYFKIIKEKLEFEILEKDIIQLTFNKEFSYLKDRLYNLEDIVKDEYFIFIHKYIKEVDINKSDKVDKIINQNIQLYLEEILYRYKNEFKEITDEYNSPLYQDKQKKFKINLYEMEYSKKFEEKYQNDEETFMFPTFNNEKEELKNLINDKAYTFVIGREKWGKTSIAYKLLSKIDGSKFYLDYDKHILGNYAPAELLKKIKKELASNVGLDSNRSLNLDNTYLLIDNIKSKESLKNILNLLEDEDVNNIKFIIFLHQKFSSDISDNKYTIDAYPSTLIQRLKDKNELENHFVQMYCEDKTMSDRLKSYQEDDILKKFLKKEFSNDFIDYYRGKIEQEKLEKKLKYKLFCLEKQLEFFGAYHLVELVKDNRIDLLREIFSEKKISEAFLELLKIQELKVINNIKKIIKKQLDVLLDGDIFEVICPNNLNIINLFYAYWSILNIIEIYQDSGLNYGNYFDFEDKRQTEEEQEIEVERRKNLVHLLKFYKLFNPSEKLVYAYQSFNKLKDKELLSNLDFSDAHIYECNFSKLVLNRVNFSNTKIEKSSLTFKESEKIYFDNTTISDSSLKNIEFSQEMIAELSFVGNNKFNDMDFTGIDFTLNISIESFINAEFLNCELIDCIFNKMDLSSAKFINCELGAAEMKEVRLCHTDFEGTNIQGVDFTDTDLSSNDYFNPDKEEFSSIKGVKGMKSVIGLDDITKQRWKEHFDKEENK